jgi:hypothetical protein
MKTRASMMIVALVLSSILLVLPTPAQASPPELLTITAEMWLTGADSAAGTFETSGLFTDAGNVSELFFIAGNTSHGIKTLVSAAGTITIKYQVQLTWTSPINGEAQGQFVIISGTGAYDSLHGVGETYAELNLATGYLWASYTGSAHFD